MSDEQMNQEQHAKNLHDGLNMMTDKLAADETFINMLVSKDERTVRLAAMSHSIMIALSRSSIPPFMMETFHGELFSEHAINYGGFTQEEVDAYRSLPLGKKFTKQALANAGHECDSCEKLKECFPDEA